MDKGITFHFNRERGDTALKSCAVKTQCRPFPRILRHGLASLAPALARRLPSTIRKTSAYRWETF
jgi:hypothetical protein